MIFACVQSSSTVIYVQSNFQNKNTEIMLTNIFFTIHSGVVLRSCKQSVNLSFAIFEESIISAILSYFPKRKDAAGFFQVFSNCWLLSNSKYKIHGRNRLGNAAVPLDNKPQFLRTLADWITEWQECKLPMAYLNYTAQDFASSLENRRPGVLPNPCYAKQPMHQVNKFLFLFSAMQNCYTCILHDDHCNCYHMF